MNVTRELAASQSTRPQLPLLYSATSRGSARLTASNCRRRRPTVRRQYLASARGDLAALRATLADDVEWTEMAGLPLGGTYRTPEGVTTNVMEGLSRDWHDWIAHDDTYVIDRDNVVVLARYTAINKATGKHLDVRVAHHFVVRGGRITRSEQFVDTARVRAAMSD